MINRLGEPVTGILDVAGGRLVPRKFMNLYFTTEEERYKTHGKIFSVSFMPGT